MALLDEYIDNGYDDGFDDTPGFLKNKESDADYLLPGLTRPKQNALVHRISRQIYNKALDAASGGFNRHPADVLAYAKNARELEKMMLNLPENTQDSHLISLMDAMGNLNEDKVRFVSPVEMAALTNGSGGAFYSPIDGKITLPFVHLKPNYVIHENSHRTGHSINPRIRDFNEANNKDYGAFNYDVYSQIPDQFGVKNMGRTFQKDIVDKIKPDPMMAPPADFGGSVTRKAMKELGVGLEDGMNAADMAVLSPTAIGKHDFMHGTKYRNEKQAFAENLPGLGLTRTGMPSASFNQYMATQNYPLSLEGSAMYDELVARNPRLAKQVSREAFNRMERIYGTDWRKKLLQEEYDRDGTMLYDGIAPRYSMKDPQFDTFIVDGEPRSFYNRDLGIGIGERYDVRVPSPYGGYYYGEGFEEARDLSEKMHSGKFQYRDIDDKWVEGDATKHFLVRDPATEVDIVRQYRDAGMTPADALFNTFRVKDKNGYHYFHSKGAADTFKDRSENFGNKVGEVEKFSHKDKRWLEP